MRAPFPTTRFVEVLLDAAGMAGLVDQDGAVRDDVAAAFCRWINKWTRRAWTIFPWPELVTLEERRWAPAWDAAAVYAVGDTVARESAGVWTYYQAVSTPVVGAAPESAPAAWSMTTTYERLIPSDQAGEIPMGAVVAAWHRDPRTDAAAQQVRFATTQHGLWFGAPLGLTLDSVWLEFRLRPSVFTTQIWEEGTAYVPGDTRYVVDAGDCYRALVATSGEYPPLAPAAWELVPMPSTLAQYVAQASYSDWLREEGQHTKAAGELSTAGELLKDIMAQVVITQGQGATYYVANT